MQYKNQNENYINSSDLTLTLEKEVVMTQSLEEEKVKIVNKPQTDPEFIR